MKTETEIIETHYYLNELPHKESPLPHHKAGLSYTASGYGRKIPTIYMVQLPDSKRWRRVYACQYSNAGTCYVQSGKDWIVIR